MPGGFIPPVVVAITGDISNLRAKIKAAQALLEDFAKNQYNASLGAEVNQSQIQSQVTQAETLVSPWEKDKTANLSAEAATAKITSAVNAAEQFVTPWQMDKTAELTAETVTGQITEAVSQAEAIVTPWQTDKTAGLTAEARKAKITEAINAAETIVAPWEKDHDTELGAKVNKSEITAALAYAETFIKRAKAKIAINADADTEQIRTAIKNAQAQVAKARADLAVDADPDLASVKTAITELRKVAKGAKVTVGLDADADVASVKTATAALAAAAKGSNIEIPVDATGGWASGFGTALKAAATTGLSVLMGRPTFWGFARTGLAAELAGAGPFHIALTAAGLVGTATEGLLGGGLLAGTGAAISIIGGLTEMGGTGQAANDIRQILALEQQLQSELATPGEAGQAKVTANQIKGFYNQMEPQTRAALQGAVGQILQFENLFNQATAEAEAKGATLIQELTKTGESYLGVIGNFAQKDISIILNSKAFQSLRQWIDSTKDSKQLEAASKALSNAQQAYNAAQKAYATGHGSAEAVKKASAQLQKAQNQMNQIAPKAGGLAIFTEIENIFTGRLPQDIQTFVTLLQKVFTTIGELAPRTGGGMQMLKNLVNMNWAPHIQNALTDWQDLKNAISGIWDAIKNFANDDKTHIGRSILQDLANLTNGFANWEKTAAGTKDINQVLQVHKAMLQGLVGVITSMVSALTSAGSAKGGVSAIVAVQTAITSVLHAISALFQIKFTLGKTPVLGTLLTSLQNFFSGLGTIVKAVPGIGPALAGLLKDLSGFFKGMAGLSVGETAAGLTALLLLFRKSGLSTKVLQVTLKPIGMLAKAIAGGAISLAAKITGWNIPNPFGQGKSSLTAVIAENTTAVQANTDALLGRTPGGVLPGGKGEKGGKGGEGVPIEEETPTGILSTTLKWGLYSLAIVGGLQVLSNEVQQMANAIKAPGGLGQKDYLKHLHPKTASTPALTQAIATQLAHDTGNNVEYVAPSLNAILENLKTQGFSEPAIAKALKPLQGTLPFGPHYLPSELATLFGVNQSTVARQLGTGTQGSTKTKAAAEQAAKTVGQGYTDAFNQAMKESKGKITAASLEALHIDPKTASALIATFKATGMKGVDAFAEAMSKEDHKPASAIAAVINTMLTKARQELKMSSPSKVFMDMGESSIEGFVKGFSETVYLDNIKASLDKVKTTNATFFAAMDKNMQQWGEQLMTELAQGITLNMGAVSQALTHSLQTAMQTAVSNSSKTATQTLVNALKQGVF